MKAISAAAGVNGRVDIFFLDDERAMHWVNPEGAPNLGGSFTSAPVVVSAYVEPSLVTNPGPVTNPQPVVHLHPVKGLHSAVSSPAAAASPPAVSSPPAAAPAATIKPLAGRTPASIGNASPPPHPTSEAAQLVHGVESARIHVQQLDVFGLGHDYAMYHTRLVSDELPDDVNSTVPWQSLGGTFTSTPAAIAWADGRVDVFAVGTNRAMYTKSIIGSQVGSDWRTLGGVFTSAASVTSQKAGQLDVFARGPDFTLRHNQLNGTEWFGWQNLDGSLASPPVAVSWGDNRVDVFAIFNDRALWHRWWDGQIWNDWESLGGQYSEEPAVATWGPGRLDVFVLGDPHLAGDKKADREIYHHWFSDGTWHAPIPLTSANPDHAVFGAPTVVASGPERLTVLAPGLETAVHDGAASQTLLQLGSSTEPWRDGKVGSATGPAGWGSRLGPVELPNQGIVSVDLVKVIEKRSGPVESDTDYVSASVAIGNWPAVTVVQALGDLGSGDEAQIDLLVGPTTMELAELVSFSYLIVNNGGAEPDKAMAALAQGASSLSQGSVTSISAQIASGVTKIVEVGIDSVLKSVPVVGSILGPIADWLIGQLSKLASAHCDGPVAAELMVFSGNPDSGAQLVAAPLVHPGTESNDGCGANSVYEVWRTVRTGVLTTNLNA